MGKSSIFDGAIFSEKSFKIDNKLHLFELKGI